MRGCRRRLRPWRASSSGNDPHHHRHPRLAVPELLRRPAPRTPQLASKLDLAAAFESLHSPGAQTAPKLGFIRPIAAKNFAEELRQFQTANLIAPCLASRQVGNPVARGVVGMVRGAILKRASQRQPIGGGGSVRRLRTLNFVDEVNRVIASRRSKQMRALQPPETATGPFNSDKREQQADKFFVRHGRRVHHRKASRRVLFEVEQLWRCEACRSECGVETGCGFVNY